MMVKLNRAVSINNQGLNFDARFLRFVILSGDRETSTFFSVVDVMMDIVFWLLQVIILNSHGLALQE